MTPKSTTITLNNGVEMPALGLGVFLAAPQDTAFAVETALTGGYRLIDTAAAYKNERQVGEGIHRSGIPRNDLFITTKLWMTSYGYDSAKKGFETSLGKLGLDYLDLYLLHWPVPSDFGKTIAAYQAIADLHKQGRIKAIGVSNFSPAHLKTLLAETDVVPTVNQIELNPFFSQPEWQSVDEEHGIVTQAWSPIAGVYNRNPKAAPESARSPLEHPVITELADRYEKTPAQIILRWHLDHGFSAIPKSIKLERIRENIDIFDFHLSAEDLESVDKLDTGFRAGSNPENVKADTFPVVLED